MKKKVKDLTIPEIRNTCKKYCNCSECPLYNVVQLCSAPCELTDLQLETEVEVDE